MIRLADVHFAYARNAEVLRAVTLELPPGLTLLVGTNGCGKSTLAKVIAGVERPSAGTITVAGHDLWRAEVAARQHLCYVPEHPDLTPYATLEEIHALVCGLRRVPLAEARSALEWAGLRGLGRRTVRELSRGQRRRALLAAARIGRPSCLVLDEPLEGLDRAFRAELLRWIAERRADGAVILVVSHAMDAFSDLADRALTLLSGQCHIVPTLPTGAERPALLARLAAGEPGIRG